MPSKRKQNKRRMRKVQAQRKALEERFVSSGWRSLGMCAFPVPVPIPVAVTAPIDIPAEVPPAEVTPTEPVMVEAPITDTIKDEVVKAAEDLRQTPVEPSAKELDDTVAIPLSEVTSSTDEPASTPAESEVQFEDTTPVATEMHVVAQPDETVNTECERELPAEDPVVEVQVPKEMVTTAETVAAVETVTETVVTEVEPVADTALEVVGIVGYPDVEAEAITIENEPTEVHKVAEVTEDVHAEPEPEEFQVEAAVPTEALVEPEAEQQQQPPSVESTSDPITGEFVGTETVAVDTTAAKEQIPETATDASKVQSERLSEKNPAPEPLPVPVAKEIIQDLAVAGGLTMDAINGCLGATKAAIEG
ncbi:chondroitin proteoglycan 1-like isoform X2 [Carassius carassius]|uniref:chondroitin proteoglycan 1-like isoform X2 n=1 Tax=Carassius carassius TaxID=217509 RepID=UPI00286966AD|nr:chondroitin proteoglycan 1-like isoform X2 [Carassius carassius]